MEDEKLHLFGEFVLDTSRGCLLRSGRPVHLRPQAYKALKYLAENTGRLISKDKLIDEVWEGRAVTDDSLVQCLRDVRHALDDVAGRYLRNERGRGYIFDPGTPESIKTDPVSTEQIDFVRLVVEEESDELGATQLRRTSTATGSGWNISTRNLVLTVTVLVVVAAAGFIAYRFFANRSADVTTIKSVAVLPFVNEQGTADLEYLSDGVSESLINSLSQLPQLKVIARSSAFEYKNKNIDLKEVSDALGVQAVLTGRVAQRDDDLIVSVELIDARDRTQIWGERYSRKAADIQSIEKEITRAISEKLRLRLTGVQEQQLTKRRTQNSEAYELYLTGIFYYRQPGMDGVKKSLDYFNRAIALDPNFAPAWVEVGRVYSFFAGNSVVNPKEPIAKAKAALQKALDLDETLADAHLELARIKRGEWQWAAAEAEYLRAIELNRNHSEAHRVYSNFLSLMTRHEEALAEIRLAQDLDPLSVRLRRDEAFSLQLARRYHEAVEKAEQALTLEPPRHGQTYFGLALIYNSNQMYPQAIDAYRKAIGILGETTSLQCYLGYSLAMSGKRKEAESILHKLRTTKEYVSPTELATFYVGMGDKEAAMAALERAYREHDLQLGTIKVDPHLDSLRGDPRFKDIMRRIGLPEI
ncbi:MAG TPA: winged helix-turn-helix domain-containing protein [Pyrinomonadaceae bacterium]|nr:winged helix-turn-helix domain-containing protein [Pyrinomonadaceae bacterium]